MFYFLFNDVYVHLCTGGPVEILKILRMFLNFKNLERASVSVRGERLKKKNRLLRMQSLVQLVWLMWC